MLSLFSLFVCKTFIWEFCRYGIYMYIVRCFILKVQTVWSIGQVCELQPSMPPKAIYIVLYVCIVHAVHCLCLSLSLSSLSLSLSLSPVTIIS